METFVKIANELEISTDNLLFGNLNNEAGNEYFIKTVLELTQNFTPTERELLLKNIELFAQLKKANHE